MGNFFKFYLKNKKKKSFGTVKDRKKFCGSLSLKTDPIAPKLRKGQKETAQM